MNDGPFRKNEYVRPDEPKEPEMTARYRRLSCFADRTEFDYRLKGQWFWRHVVWHNSFTNEEAEEAVKRWLECYARTGVV